MRKEMILLLAALLGGCSAEPTSRGGIVSTNPCADQMLVELVPPERIAAISHYSEEAGATSIPLSVARRFRSTAGTAEEVIALRPDLVVTSSFTPVATRDAYKRAGLDVLLLDSPTSVAASERQVMQLADAVGAHSKGIAMVRRIEIALAAASPHPVRVQRSSDTIAGRCGQRGFSTSREANGTGCDPATLLYLSGDLVTGPGTLLDELLRRAGFHDAAPDYGLSHSGNLPLETIIDRPPDLILMPDLASRPAKLRAAVLQYRTRFGLFPRTLIDCGGPTIIPAVETLAAIRRKVTS
jgi:iron complex transport system substrate-binding protein